jgi:hypothetical protein
MKLSDTPIEPVVKRRVVPIVAETAFELFTAGLATWWPLATHSIAEERVAGVRFEPTVGGRVVEVATDGTAVEWADVIAWDPPHRVALAWHPNPGPEAATIVDVRFTPVEGGTQVDLVHRAFEELGATDGQAARDRYEAGWEPVLDDFVVAATR